MRVRKHVLGVVALALVASACGGADPTDPGTATDDGAATEDGAEDDGDTGDDGEATGEGDVLRVGFVHVSPVTDGGWTTSHDNGAQAVADEFGDRVEITTVDQVAEGPDAERVIEDLARQGHDIIFATSFGFMEPMLAVAEQYPDVVFEHATGYLTADNMGNYFGAAEEGRYLEGMAAAAASETGELGYVAAFPIPEVVRGINAWTLGARSVNPDATVRVVWTSTWYDPDLEGQAAQSLLDAGVDAIGMHQDTPATGQAADAVGAKWTGYHTDRSDEVPDAWLTATVWDWGPFYVQRVQEVMDGTWESQSYYGTMADGMVNLAPFGESVPEDIQGEIETRQQEIIDGDFEPFTGPINDQDGQERVADGESMSFEDLMSFDWFVEGVIGDVSG
ncbi:BMP family ABC transporter substrate-binding protein [Nitriliruptor alkaliphilus]|uniref:BMP family ABC transporter substrate-binding protein n=1 Tax=Nitriliruptor alkaliphilus TaxID=427918 RepID=UPI0009FB1359|nr:BMP family ABC transporter substrate-binding protein [Nitriliruptor alkaliphilus]